MTGAMWPIQLDFDAEVQAPQLIDALKPVCRDPGWTIKNAQITLDKMQFRAVFVVGRQQLQHV